MKCVVSCAASLHWRSTSAMRGRSALPMRCRPRRCSRRDLTGMSSTVSVILTMFGFTAFSRGLAVDVGDAFVAATMAPAPVSAVAPVLTVAGEMPDPALFRRHFPL